MKDPVGNIKICLYAGPDKDAEVENQPAPAMKVQEFIYTGEIVPGEHKCAQQGCNRTHSKIWKRELKRQQQPENQR